MSSDVAPDPGASATSHACALPLNPPPVPNDVETGRFAFRGISFRADDDASSPSIAFSLDVDAKCIYSMHIVFRWSQARRMSNLRAHGLDFADAERVFSGPTFTFEDDRSDTRSCVS